MTQKNLKLTYAWVSTGHFFKGRKIRLHKNWLSILAEREVPQRRNWWWSGEFMVNYDGYGFVLCMTCPTSCPCPTQPHPTHPIPQHVHAPSAIHTYENFSKMFHSFYLADYSKVSTFFWDTRYRKAFNPVCTILHVRGWAEKFIGWLCCSGQIWPNVVSFSTHSSLRSIHFFHWCLQLLDFGGIEALILILEKVLICRPRHWSNSDSQWSVFFMLGNRK